MTFASGILGKAFIGANELPITRWSADPSLDQVDFKNSKTGRYTDFETTFKDLRVTIDVEYDVDANPFAAPTNLLLDATVTSVKLYIKDITGPYWLIPTGKVISTPQSVEISGRITTSFTIRAKGIFKQPGEA